MEALDYAVGWLTGDKFFRLETKYQRAIALILEFKELTLKGSLSAFLESLIYTEVRIEKKIMDYKKRLSDLNVMFYLKKQDQEEHYVDFIEETMKCLGTYAKPYGKKHKDEEVLYVIISAYAATEEEMPLVNTLKRNPTGLKFIHNWAAVEWFPKTETIKTYNLGLDGSDDRTKHRLEVITRYDETDQRKTPPYLVPKFFDPIADEIIQGYRKVISLENFYKFIELCKKPQTDAPKHVSKFTSDIPGLIKLVEECLSKVSFQDDQVLYLRLKNIMQALKKTDQPLKEINLKGQKKQPYLVPESFKSIADQIIKGYREVISLEKFNEFIELCQNPETDAPKHVSKFTSDSQGLIKLVEECLTKVSFKDDRVLYLRLKNIIKALKETDQPLKEITLKGQKNQPYLVPESFKSIADQIIKGYREVISLEKFNGFIELCQNPETDAPKHVSKFTSDSQGLIKLVEECLNKVLYKDDRVLYLRLKNIIKALKVFKPKGT
jgi:hypothetical protein